MANTNHNLWTLTKNVAHSVNKTAGKIDVIVYGDKTTNAITKVTPTPKVTIEVSPKPKAPERPIDPNAPSAIVFAVLLAFLAGSGLYFLKRRKS